MLKLEAKHIVKIMLSADAGCSCCARDLLKQFILMVPRWERMIEQMFYEEFENGRNFDNVPKRELKQEKYINNWWDNLEIEVKRDIIKKVLSWQTQKFRTRYFKRINRYLKEELAESYKE